MQQFVPKTGLDFSPANEKSWQAELGSVAYGDHVVFTKESLILFLRLHDIVVDPNGTELKKLPRFAQFGNLIPVQDTDSSAEIPAATAIEAPTPEKSVDEPAPEEKKKPFVTMPNGDEFRPTRKVRELPGGGSKNVYSLFGGDDEQTDENTPPPSAGRNSKKKDPFAPSEENAWANTSSESADSIQGKNDGFRPTRKVRELPGGGSKRITALFGGDD